MKTLELKPITVRIKAAETAADDKKGEGGASENEIDETMVKVKYDGENIIDITAVPWKQRFCELIRDHCEILDKCNNKLDRANKNKIELLINAESYDDVKDTNDGDKETNNVMEIFIYNA